MGTSLMMSEWSRACAWCGGHLPARMRADARFCGQVCRQRYNRHPSSAHASPLEDGRVARSCAPSVADAGAPSVASAVDCRKAHHRFEVQTRGVVAMVPAETPRRIGIADPPYPGKAWLYKDHPDYGGEVDHDELLRRLVSFDGWALATSGEAAGDLLCLARSMDPRVRLAPWVRGARTTRGTVPTAAWEAVLFVPARAGLVVGAQVPDAFVFHPQARTSDPARVIGAKPAAWTAWVLGLVQAAPGDDVVDLFPGSGGVARAVELAMRPPS